MEAIVLLQIWFGGEALLVPMPDYQACKDAVIEYPAGMASCRSPPPPPKAIISMPKPILDDTCLSCVRGMSGSW